MRPIARGAAVVPIPGASAVLAAIVASGLAGDGRFRFVGFLPRDGAARREAIALVCETPEAVVLFEAPSRVADTLRELADATPERGACVARELTKLHEEFVRSTLRGARRGRARVDRRDRDRARRRTARETARSRIDDAALDARIDEALGSRRSRPDRSPSGSRPGADGRGARSTNESCERKKR